jgi:peptidoglycan/LPS O-acetylase OafA/YrhL
VELVFYLACALLFLLAGRVNLVLSLICMGLAWLAIHFKLLAGTPDHWPFLPVDLTVMFWGCCCRLIYEDGLPVIFGKYRRAAGHALMLALLTLVMWEPLSLLSAGYAHGLRGHMRLGWGYSLGVVSFLIWVIIAKVRSRTLESIGRSTYSIYLLHPVVFYVVFKLLHQPIFSTWRGMHLGLYIAMLMVLCVLSGMLAYRLIEQPSDMMRRLLRQPGGGVPNAMEVQSAASSATDVRRLIGSRGGRWLRLRYRGRWVTRR